MPQKIDYKDLPDKIDYSGLPDKVDAEPAPKPSKAEEIYQQVTTPLVPTRSGLVKEATDAAAQQSTVGKVMNLGLDTLGSLTSPLGLTALFGGAEAMAAKAAYPTVARALGFGTRAAGAAATAHGISNMKEDPVWGAAEALGGLAGMRVRNPALPPIFEGKPTMGSPTGKMDLRTPVKPGKPFLLKEGYPEHINALEAEGAVVGSPFGRGGRDITMYPKAAEGQRPGPRVDLKKSSQLAEWANLPRGITTSFDASAPFRQGIGLIHRKEFWTNLKPMFSAMKSEADFQQLQDSIMKHPNFKRAEVVVGGKVRTLPSFAERSGIKLSDLSDLTSREEQIMSTMSEKIPLGIGKGVRASNRGYTVFLNKVRADTFNSMVADLEKAGIPIKSDVPRAKAIASFINDATGRGSLGKFEKSAGALSNVFFSPRLMASRVRMINRYMNPWSYAQAPPEVRKETLKSLFALATAGGTVLGVAKMGGAEMNTDPDSADFGKAIIGNVRIDPWAGFQQYAVLAHRLISGQYTTEGEEKTYGEGYGVKTRKDAVIDFATNKANPVAKFVADWLGQAENRPFSVPKEALEMLTPIMTQDIYELMKEDPKLIPLAIPAAMGMGVQVGSGQ